MGLRQQRADANYFTVDGVSANFGVTGCLPLVQTAGGALPALSASGGTNSLVAVEELCPPQFTHVPFRVFGGEQQRRNLHCGCWGVRAGQTRNRRVAPSQLDRQPIGGEAKPRIEVWSGLSPASPFQQSSSLRAICGIRGSDHLHCTALHQDAGGRSLRYGSGGLGIQSVNRVSALTLTLQSHWRCYSSRIDMAGQDRTV